MAGTAPARPGSTPRTRVRRIAEKTVRETEVMYAILDAGLVAHVAVTGPDGQPFVVPVAYARSGHSVLFHGSTGSRLFRGLAQGAPTCLTVTLLDGMVLARSTFESSMNYRSVMALGSCSVLSGAPKLDALERITDHLLPGRWAEARHPSKKETAATTVLCLALTETSVKVNDGPPDDQQDDLALPIWAGNVPIVQTFGRPVDAPDLRHPVPVPSYLKRWKR
jgi:nitroimidazol reductase NimA-like FMN-containing flavoprotein (pyridoxamine 5'-phosphate oxidase superfamily)